MSAAIGSGVRFGEPHSDGAFGTGVSQRRLLGVLLLAMTLRIVWACAIPVVPVSDSNAYDTFARTLAESGVFGWNKNEPFAFWPPGTSMIYSVVYRVFGVQYLPIVVLNVLLSIGIIVSTMRWACRFGGPRCSLFAGLVLAVWPTLVLFTTVLASELPFMLLVTVAFDLWTLERGRPWRRALVAGALLGAAAMVRPVALALPALIAFSCAVQGRIGMSRLLEQGRMWIVAMLALACLVAPWAWRNYVLYNHVALISTNGGTTLWMGNAPGTTGEYMDPPDWALKLNDYERDQELGRIAREQIRADPFGFLRLSGRKLIWLYNHESIGVVWNEPGIEQEFGVGAVRPLKGLTHASWALIVLAAAWGAVALFTSRGVRRALFDPLIISVIFYSAVHAAIVSQDRYHLEFAPQMAILAGLGLASVRVRRLSSL